MLTSEEFSAWCQRNKMSPEAEVTIQRIRTSPPSRRVRTSGEYHPQYIQNLKFLQNFWTHPFSISPQAKQRFRDALAVYQGISVDAILQAHPDLVVDVVWAMLTTQSILPT